MTTKILVNSARERFHHAESRIYMTEKYTAKLNVAHGGGLWQITPELITYLRSSTNEKEILLDSYGNPVEVNREQFLDLVQKTYQQVMLDWHTEYTKLSKFR